jgi:CHAT domain-containing protein
MKNTYFLILFLCLAGNNLLPAQDGFSDNDSTKIDSTNHALRSSLIKLNWAEREIMEIAKSISGNSFFYENASEDNFKKYVSDAQIIHLATHAVVDDKNPMYSKLAFHKLDNSPEDGFLNTYEIYNLDLNAQMVVLSACNTGYGKIVKGEGVMSLARSFMYAGSPSIIMSLWQVDDYPTYRIMQEFYKGLEKKLPKDAALREAKLKYIQNSDPVKAGPYYWSGFIPIGNTDPIELPDKSNYTNYILSILSLTVLSFFVFKKLRVS